MNPQEMSKESIMKQSVFLILFLGLTACKPEAREPTKECIQAMNRESVYTKSLEELHELYKGDLASDEAKSRISAMENRIKQAKNYQSQNCEVAK
ncbi:TPA: hypothetical protein NJ543_004481 [Vibrio parahaemolyticus]|uniref:hypothetical protein n=2 Tax=Vibrio parahaemolyticus TaxID=670 RepID=UPI0015DDF501|nr:hypothetical protein [Vibrio parahaemolyticus]HCE1934587.1 hypothetical protein [Vibrio parahaemolyticus]HCG8326569.1 hypothetical protein [Vibrio parahaemolyticus]